ncbi:MAG: TetR/AcrR family transcriptional regulator [Rhizobacter sp.]|nr:TetR/AcrR family transcriptional regulator [Chlorobiales bacterium]
MIDTRQKILESNFKAMHRSGYNAMRADKEILKLGITKGALYHHFPTKQDLGYAIVDELIYKDYVGGWSPLNTYRGNPIDFIVSHLNALQQECTDKEIGFGCPLNNLIQEMSPTDKGFRIRLARILNEMHTIIKNALTRGQKNGGVSKSIKPDATVWFILSAMEGGYAMGKATQSREVFIQATDQLILYLESLKV